MATTTLEAMKLKRQLRWFVVFWTFLTVVMGACTFFAIFWVLGETGLPGSSGRSFALPTLPPTQAAVVMQPTALPTNEPAEPTEMPATEEPTVNPNIQAQAAIAQAQTLAAIATIGDPTAQATAAATSTPLPVSNRAFQPGIQVQFSLDLNPDNQDNWMREVAEKMDLDWFKQQVRWEDIEPERGQFDWSKMDLVMPSKNRFNLNIMLSIVASPAWAAETAPPEGKHSPPANNADFINFVTAILERYPGQIQAIEVWNEQNLDREWYSRNGLSASNYVLLLRETYQAVKNLEPGIIVISGALAPTGGFTEPNGVVSAIDDFVYLDALLAAGMLNYVDCVGVHHNGYNIGPSIAWDAVPPDATAQFRGPFDNPHHSWSFFSTLNTYAEKIELAGGDQPLCITEFGWASSEDLAGYPRGFEFAADNTLQEQSDYIIEALDLMEEWDFVWLAFIWNFNYAPQAGWDPNNDNVPYSIIGNNWVFRPAYDAIIAWSRERRETVGQ
jgi:polysaccharide biosynthesis protein PslG